MAKLLKLKLSQKKKKKHIVTIIFKGGELDIEFLND